MSLTEYVGFAIREFRRFAKKYQCHVIVAAHPAKMTRGKDGQYPVPSLYDISDSAHWTNKPDIGIVIHRASEEEMVFKVAKSRFHDVLGKPGDYTFRFNRHDMHFTKLAQPAVRSWAGD
jgi:twinkle protein